MARARSTIHLFAGPKKKISAVDLVIDKIKALLIAKKLKPGDLLPSESALAESIGVSRGSLREAMKILSSFGIVEIRRGDGTYVSTSANNRIFDPLIFSLIVMNTSSEELIQLREMMEIGVINLVIRAASEADIRQLADVQDQLGILSRKSEPDLAELNECDLNFHRVMARITHNHLVENMYNFVIDIYAPTIDARFALDVHQKILEAIIKRDPEKAAEAEREHIGVWRRSRGM